MEINIYCDESCHLENDKQPAMVIGAVWCPKAIVPEVSGRLKEIKAKYGLGSTFEVKWTKVSPARALLYKDLIDYFFDNEELHFRAVVIPDKSILDHAAHHQDHDTWYYKMFYELLIRLISPTDQFNIYLDIKDTRSRLKIATLRDRLCSSSLDFKKQIIKKVQPIRSHEVQLDQLADLLIGAVCYNARGLSGSETKKGLVELIKRRSGYSLEKTTLLREQKFNLLIWKPTPAV